LKQKRPETAGLSIKYSTSDLKEKRGRERHVAGRTAATLLRQSERMSGPEKFRLAGCSRRIGGGAVPPSGAGRCCRGSRLSPPRETQRVAADGKPKGLVPKDGCRPPKRRGRGDGARGAGCGAAGSTPALARAGWVGVVETKTPRNGRTFYLKYSTSDLKEKRGRERHVAGRTAATLLRQSEKMSSPKKFWLAGPWPLTPDRRGRGCAALHLLAAPAVAVAVAGAVAAAGNPKGCRGRETQRAGSKGWLPPAELAGARGCRCRRRIGGGEVALRCTS
jgi:hypothetical protein